MLFTDSIKFDTSGWEILAKSPRLDVNINLAHCRVWKNDIPDLLSLHFFPVAPDIPRDLSSVTELRNFYRDSVKQASGGLVSVDVLSIQGISAIQTVFKFRQKHQGMIYLSSLIFPLKDCSYVIKTECREYGITGMRDAIVFALYHQSLPVEVDKERRVKGWFQDPYDSLRQDPIMRNLSEDEKYDADFPRHPLSRARRYLKEIQASLEFSTDFFAANFERDFCK